MEPSASVTNALKSLFIYRVVFGHLVAGLSCLVAGADFTNLVFGKLCRALFFTSRGALVCALSSKFSEGVKLIALVVGRLKIFNSVVVLDAVQVVDHQSARDGAYKSLVDKAVDLKGLYLVGPLSEAKGSVSVLVSTAAYKIASAAQKAAKARYPIPRPAGNVGPNLFSVFVFHTEGLPVCSFRVNGIPTGQWAETLLTPMLRNKYNG